MLEEKTIKILDLKKSWTISLKERLVTRYLKLLETDALATKCVTAGLLSLVGDFFAQTYQSRSKKLHLNKLRAFALVFESTFLSGPLMHYAYDYMEQMLPISKSVLSFDEIDVLAPLQVFLRNQWTASFLHVAVDIMILGPLYVLSIMITSGLIEGNRSTIWPEFKLDFLPTVRASTITSILFSPIQMLAFKVLPVHLRLLYMNIQDIVWNSVVSFYAHRSR